MSVKNAERDSSREIGDEQTEPSGDSPPPDDEPEQLSLDVIFEVLKNERRRLALKYLRTEESTVSLGTLAEHIAAIENDKDESMIRSDERKRVYVGLYQCHLPKMDDMGIVEFNRDRGLIELTDTADQLYEYIDSQEQPDQDRWYQYYGGLSVVALAATVRDWNGLLPGAGVVLGAVVFAFACCSTAHVASRVRRNAADRATQH
jgi:hypothetical protein